MADGLVALHGTDPATAPLAVLARSRLQALDAVGDALYEQRSLLRLLAMRRTVFVVSRAVAPVVQAACGHAVAVREGRKLVRYLVDNGVVTAADADSWLAGAREAALRSLAARGRATAAEIAADDDRLATRLVLSPGRSDEGSQSVASRLLLILAAEGAVVRGRPRGSWLSTRHSWSPMSAWLPGGMPHLATAEAEAELARRWLSRYGPATPADLQWWTGWTVTQVRRALAASGAVEVDLAGRPGVALPDDLDPVPAPEPWAALLPALDPTPMGWQLREWFLGEHGPRLFDRAGNIGPSLWWDGRVVGGWAHAATGEVVWRFLADVGADAEAAVARAAVRVRTALGADRLAPRTRGLTWLEQELRDAGR